MTNKNDSFYYYFEADKEGNAANNMKTMKTIINNIWKDLNEKILKLNMIVCLI